MPRVLGLFDSVINNADTRYIGQNSAAALAGRRRMGPVGERARNFLMSGRPGGLRNRAMQTAKRVMEFRGRGLGRVGDLPQGAFTVSEAFKKGLHDQPRGALNPQVGSILGNPRGFIVGDIDNPVSPRMRINIDPSGVANPKYRIQAYNPRRGFETSVMRPARRHRRTILE
jgi:hypothetical protein